MPRTLWPENHRCAGLPRTPPVACRIQYQRICARTPGADRRYWDFHGFEALDCSKNLLSRKWAIYCLPDPPLELQMAIANGARDPVVDVLAQLEQNLVKAIADARILHRLLMDRLVESSSSSEPGNSSDEN
ncbi:hypothetical protein NDU88_006035 [Pleurodeles waltl]|uniref:Uncharacterized protein n=1 Tax=Pleurodeles waltl TaxID=8319 RepID=A0AAV7MZP8_PLEWA|nr:hypothetical protein NDU88_006035 [Pleurodeles waltl]